MEESVMVDGARSEEPPWEGFNMNKKWVSDFPTPWAFARDDAKSPFCVSV